MHEEYIMDKLPPEVRADYLDRIHRFVLMDDTFMAKVFEDKKCVELLLKIILEKDLTVEKVVSQYSIKNLQGRSIRLDIYAVDSSNKHYNIEVQRDNGGADPKRARYNSALMDANLILPGDDWDKLPDNYVIFITQNDVLGGGAPVYTIERTVRQKNNVSFEDHSHIIYVNGECRDSSAIGKLMQDFFCTDPAKMNYNILAERTRFFKEDKEGANNMCKIMEELRDKTAAEVTAERNREIALKFIQLGSVPLEQIAEATGLTLDEVKKLAEKHTA